MRNILITLLYLLPLALFAQVFEEGDASWYGGKFQGRQTANGEIFDTEKMTAAHKTLPFNTVVKVINLSNNKSTIVRINDRGPFAKERIIDLSRAAAAEIDMVDAGVAPVQIEILQKEELADAIYRIQAGTFSIIENADKLRTKLEALGLSIAYEKTTTDYTRVCVINIKHQELDKILKSLEELQLTGLIVRKATVR